MKETDKIDLTKGHALKKVFILSFPLIVSNLMQVFYSIADTAWLGVLGKEEVAAMAFVFPVIFLIISIGIGIGMAGSILVAQYEGAGDKGKVNHVAAQTFTLSMVLAVIISVAGYFSGGYLVNLLGAEPEVARLAVSYLKIMFPGVIFMFGFFVFSSLMRGWGNTKTPMKIMVVTNIINIALDPLLIFGIGFFPEMGVRGAAWATVISRFLASLAGFYILFRGRNALSISLKSLKPDFNVLKKICRLGWPATLEHGMRAVGFMILTAIVAGYGTVYVAAYSVGTRIFHIFIMPSLAISMGVSAGVGQNLGAGFKDRAVRLAIDSALVVFGALVLVAAALYISNRYIVRIFISSGGHQTISAAVVFIKRLAFTAPFIGAAITLRGAFSGAGRTFQSMCIGLIGLMVIRVPAAYLLSSIFNSPVGIWNAFIIGAVGELVLCVLYYIKSDWAVSVVDVSPEESLV